MNYSGAGWLVQREVQVANGSEVTTYTYDAWGRLRGVDYPRSVDVRMGWDGENRRVWVQDGAGRREYSYDAWGRVVRQEGCCGEDTQLTLYSYFGLGGCCGGLSTNRSVMEDAWWMPGDFETAVPALCVGACVCGAACLALLIIPCLERARGASDPLRCLLECIKERLGNASGWVQLICGVCVVGCAVCLFVGVPGGLPALAPVPTPVPAPVFAVASAASVVASPCDPPVAPPPGPSCTTCFRARTTFKSSYSHTFSTSHSRTES